jgi:hypothetical protein
VSILEMMINYKKTLEKLWNQKCNKQNEEKMINGTRG